MPENKDNIGRDFWREELRRERDEARAKLCELVTILEGAMPAMRRARKLIQETEVHDLADGPVEIPPGETRTFVIHPVDPDDPEGEQEQVDDS